MKRFLPFIILLLCLTASPAWGQGKAFTKAFKNGPDASGYYHADMSKSPVSRRDLAMFAAQYGYSL